jgi:hypothetical protein
MAQKIIPEARSRARLLSFIKEYKDKTGLDVAGSNRQIQFNVSGSLGADANLVWDTEDGDGLGIGLHYYGNEFPQIHLDVNYGYLDDLDADTGGGESVAFGTGTTVAGKLYYLETSGVWTETDADHASGKAGDWQLLGIALGTDPATHGMLLRGFFQATTYFQGSWAAGQAVYVSTTAGNIDATAPTTSGDFVRIVGWAAAGTTDLIYFNPIGSTVVP